MRAISFPSIDIPEQQKMRYGDGKCYDRIC